MAAAARDDSIFTDVCGTPISGPILPAEIPGNTPLRIGNCKLSYCIVLSIAVFIGKLVYPYIVGN